MATAHSVLLLDIDRQHRLRAEEIIAALGYEPVGFANGKQALNAFRTEPNRFDLIIIDNDLADLAPMQLAAAIVGMAPGRPILLCARSGVELNINALSKVGIDEVIRKPLYIRDVADALSRSINRISQAD